jgi:hypothetical protein
LFETIWEQMMNERIRELADKIWEEKYWTNPNTDKLLPAQLNRFAELIVRECVDKITTYDLVPGHSAKWEDIYDIHARLLQDLGEELKEHFGVTK